MISFGFFQWFKKIGEEIKARQAMLAEKGLVWSCGAKFEIRNETFS